MRLRIWAWGANKNGQLGLGFSSEQESVPTEINVCTSEEGKVLFDNKELRIVPRDICGGAAHTLCLAVVGHDNPLKLNEDIKGKPNGLDPDGVNPLHIIKVSDTFQIICFPQELGEGVQREVIASGFDANFCKFKDDELYSFGDNAYNQLGRQITEVELKQQKDEGKELKKQCTEVWGKLNFHEHFKSISVGLRHAAGITCNNAIYVWGDNSKYQLGIFEVTPAGTEIYPAKEETPTKVDATPGMEFTHVACGKDFTIAVHEGRLFGSGQNKYGVLLHAPQDIQAFPKFVQIYDQLVADADVFDVQCGWSHVLVLLTDGRVISWGRNNFGQLGRPSVNPDFDVEPAFVKFPERIVNIKCGSEHNLALTRTGKVYAWGWNEHDNCGVKTSAKPPQEQGGAGSRMLEYAEEHSLPSSSSTSSSSSSAKKEDYIPVPTLVDFGVPFPEEVPMAVIGCGAGSSFAIAL